MPYVAVAKLTDIPQGKGISVRVGKKSIAIFHVEGKYYAMDDYCPHQGAPIANGYISANDVTCSWHGASFDLSTGKGVAGPCGSGITPYTVRIVGDDIELEFADLIAEGDAI